MAGDPVSGQRADVQAEGEAGSVLGHQQVL